MSRRAVGEGHDVTVVTAMPNYPSGVVREDYRKRLVLAEELDGVHVVRSWIHGHRGRGTLHQMVGYGSFAASSLVTAPFRLRRADVLHWLAAGLFERRLDQLSTAERLELSWGWA